MEEAVDSVGVVGGVAFFVDGEEFLLMSRAVLREEREDARQGGVCTGKKSGRREGRAAQLKTEERRRARREEDRQVRALKATERASLVADTERRRGPVSLVASLKRYLKAHPEQLEQVTLAVIHRARQGDPRMIEMIFNRMDGAVVQKQQMDSVVHVKRYGFVDPGVEARVLDVEGVPLGMVSSVVDGLGGTGETIGFTGSLEGVESQVVPDGDVPLLGLDESLDEHGELVWAPKTLTKRQSAEALKVERERRSIESAGVSVEAGAAVEGLSDDELRGVLSDLGG